MVVWSWGGEVGVLVLSCCFGPLHCGCGGGGHGVWSCKERGTGGNARMPLQPSKRGRRARTP